jgi:hypothetical protein
MLHFRRIYFDSNIAIHEGWARISVSFDQVLLNSRPLGSSDLRCGDFCVESTNISHQRGASQNMEQQRDKFCKSSCVGSKSLKTKHVPRGAMQLLLISGLQVQVLPGSPRFPGSGPDT